MMTTDLVPVVESTDVVQLPSIDSARQQLRRVEDFKRVVRELFVQGHDYGVIPGTGDKPTLLKPGAEKLIKLLGLADQYDFLEKVEDWDRGFFNYTVRCRLVSLQTGQVVAEGLGNCNSWESKYRWRWVFASELSEPERVGRKTRQVNTRRGSATMYRVENDDMCSSLNTILKMAKKRAQMDAALSAGRLSDVFTQDLEDITENRRAASGEASDYQQATPPTESTVNAPTGVTTVEMTHLDDSGVRGEPTKAQAPGAPISTTHDPLWQRWIGLLKLARETEGVAFQSIPDPSGTQPITQADLKDRCDELWADIQKARGKGAEPEESQLPLAPSLPTAPTPNTYSTPASMLSGQS